ncbi:SAM-dependent methyltransferase [Flavobacterium album]|uniref:site-specific DNA-methyltransferase (adenine-specific) n=1 Tax=Flavobacterium album TaxID=2175091 RepID=A0A2S1R107_9FLAO|nr:N-6 DNA methylase [Flavobacterium album]AWH86302.1 SAM-dependent methyltransferase [Flavobacterium album]
MKNSIASRKNNSTTYSLLREGTLTALLPETDPLKTLHSGRIMAKAWAKDLPENKKFDLVQNFIRQVIVVYWQIVHDKPVNLKRLPPFQYSFRKARLDNSATAVANALGRAVARFGVTEAAFHVGTIYTSLLPDTLRSKNGIFYTPPSLSSRLIEMSEASGVNWSTAKVADPACGGGAFLAPVALKIMESLPDLKGLGLVEHLEANLRGYEIDPFAAWITQVFLEVAVKDRIVGAKRNVRSLVTICNTLEYEFGEAEQYDLVIGNPPYGKVSISDATKEKYKESLFGHANLYGLFTHLAINMTKSKGIVSYLTPTSFLSGEYFKNLRSYILSKASPSEIDFVAIRKGVFEDVLQETMLAVYKKQTMKQAQVDVNEIITSTEDESIVESFGTFNVKALQSNPWILPRTLEQSKIIPAMSKMRFRLSDWGYKISTGQLVWNRNKAQLSDTYKKNAFPVIWSESITQEGNFVLRAEKKNHSTWFHYKGEEYLLTRKPCLLLQRTTSKEQEKRLNAAILPQELLDKRKAVVVENHINIISASEERAKVELNVLCVFLNSKAVNDAFRTISGSVAVSAYELGSLPVPSPQKLKKLKELVDTKAHPSLIEKECHDLYTLHNE